MSSMEIQGLKLIHFDEVRTNLEEFSSVLDKLIISIKDKEEEDLATKNQINYYRGLLTIADGEIKHLKRDFINASNAFSEGEKIITKLLKMGNLSEEQQLEIERLAFFAKGRYFECLAFVKGISIEEQIRKLSESVSSYSSEVKVTAKITKHLPLYNCKARENYIQGLLYKNEGDRALASKDYRLAKKKHLNAYRFFAFASYFNPLYNTFPHEESEILRKIVSTILEQRANITWKEAFSLSNEGKFQASSVKCLLASKFFKRASSLTSDIKNAKLLLTYYYLLQASMYEANANNHIKNNNDAKSAIRQYELASNFMKQTIESYPKKDEDRNTYKRWQSQQRYYEGNYFESQGIVDLDLEKYKEAFQLFSQAESHFLAALKIAEESKDAALTKLIQKSISEVKGYAGMCKTVIE